MTVKIKKYYKHHNFVSNNINNNKQKSRLLINLLIYLAILIIAVFLQQFYITRKVLFTQVFKAPSVMKVQPKLSRSLSTCNGGSCMAFFRDQTTSAITTISSHVLSCDSGIFSSKKMAVETNSNSKDQDSSVLDWSLCFSKASEKQRSLVAQQSRVLLGSKPGGVVAAITLGETELLSSQFRDQISSLGLQHIFAPSGYHLGLVALIISSVLPKSLGRGWLTFILVLSTSWYLWLTGVRPSLIRACLMLWLGLGARLWFGRSPPAILRLLLTIGLVYLALPEVMISLSFQLSALATGGILLFAPIFLKLDNIVLRFEKGDFQAKSQKKSRWIFLIWQHVFGLVVVGIAAQMAIFPLVLDQFGSLQVFGPIASVAIVWLVPILLLFGLTIAAISPLFVFIMPISSFFLLPVAKAFSVALWFVTAAFDYLVELLPPPLEISSLPANFSSLWWGGLILLRAVIWLIQQKRRARLRVLC